MAKPGSHQQPTNAAFNGALDNKQYRFAEHTATSHECSRKLQSAGNAFAAQLNARAAYEAQAMQSPTTAEIAAGDYYDGPVTIEKSGCKA